MLQGAPKPIQNVQKGFGNVLNEPYKYILMGPLALVLEQQAQNLAESLQIFSPEMVTTLLKIPIGISMLAGFVVLSNILRVSFLNEDVKKIKKDIGDLFFSKEAAISMVIATLLLLSSTANKENYVCTQVDGGFTSPGNTLIDYKYEPAVLNPDGLIDPDTCERSVVGAIQEEAFGLGLASAVFLVGAGFRKRYS